VCLLLTLATKGSGRPAAVSSLQHEAAKLQDQADTIASLQLQLKQQQQLLAALQRRERRVSE